MEFFNSLRIQDETIYSYLLPSPEPDCGEMPGKLAFGALDSLEEQGGLFFASDKGTILGKDDLKDQFLVFQLNKTAQGDTLLEASQVDPELPGSDEKPDMLVALEMLSFHFGAGEKIQKDSRATLRINFGQDQSATDRRFATLTWAVAAGLQLYNEAKGEKAEGTEFKADLHEALGYRPIEIPGGLSKLQFEVVKHKEPSWWQRIFSFTTGTTGRSLISTLGFPAVTISALNFIDGLLNRLEGTEPSVLFRSAPMRLALSQRAKKDFTAGIPNLPLGALNPGVCVLARGRDYPSLSETKAIYNPIYDKLVPLDVKPKDLISGNYTDPFKDMTYAAFRVKMVEQKLNPLM